MGALVGLGHVKDVRVPDADDLTLIELIGGDDLKTLLAFAHDATGFQPGVESAHV